MALFDFLRDTTNPTAEENQRRFKELRDARQDWDVQSRHDLDFFLGNHFSEQETENLAERNQADVAFDRIGPAVEQLKSMLTAQPPKFSAQPRESSDAERAAVWRTLLEYVWDISDGDEHFKQSIQDYAVLGLGYLYGYIDYKADYGRGEVKVKHLDPYRVFVDPYAKHRYYDDAHDMFVSTIYTQEQLLDEYSELAPVIHRITSLQDEDFPDSTQHDSKGIYTPPDVEGLDGTYREKYRVLERFVKTEVDHFRVLDNKTGEERIKSKEDFEAWLNIPGMAQLITEDRYEITQVPVTRIKQEVTVGDYLLSERIMPLDRFPVVPVPNVWTKTPYPMGDVRRAKEMQRFLNKMFSIVMAHAQSSAGLKLLVPEGSVDDQIELEQRWANPNAAITYNPEHGEPHIAQVPPLNTVHYQLIERAENYIDFTFGIWEVQHGNPSEAPRTAAGTMMMEDFGQRRTKSKLRDVEGSLGRVGKVVHRLAKNHYTRNKMLKVAQPNNIRTAEINVPVYDDMTGAIEEIKNDISIGEEDIRVQKNSTLPSNMYGELQVHLDFFDRGIIDDVEVLKKAPIYDKEGLLQRKSIYSQQNQVIETMDEYIKELEGDLQTAQRESLHDRKRLEVEKSKGRLKDIERDVKSELEHEAQSVISELTLAQEAAKDRTNENGSE